MSADNSFIFTVVQVEYFQINEHNQNNRTLCARYQINQLLTLAIGMMQTEGMGMGEAMSQV